MQSDKLDAGLRAWVSTSVDSDNIQLQKIIKEHGLIVSPNGLQVKAVVYYHSNREMAAIRQLKLVVYEKGPGESLKDFRPENWTFVITYWTTD
jgi:hypothetical protein